MCKVKCQRCGELGHDRRTLWMACLYRMDESNIPFEEKAVHGQMLNRIGTKHLEIWNQEVPVWSEPKQDAEPARYQFYTLRVCKSCRSDWLAAIQDWFNSVPDSLVPDSPDANIPVRVLGATRMVTEEEY